MLKFVLSAVLMLLTFPVHAQHIHHDSEGPTETGQSAFAAVSEIVKILSDDPSTDWTKVNINALRDHLVDMELVTTETKAKVQVEGRRIEFQVTGQGDVASAVVRLTMAHAPMLERATGWAVSAEPSDGGATLHIRVDSDQELKRVVGLGFFGVMTLGAHHRSHHMQMALGTDPHH